MYEFSRYLRVRESKDSVAVFHELHPQPLYLNREEWRKFVGSPSPQSANLFEALRLRQLLIESSREDDLEWACARSRLERKLNRTTILYLMLAQGCNLECSYCPIPHIAKRRGEVLLSHEDAVAGVDLWLRHIKDDEQAESYSIIFYGGEPLLNLPVLKTVLEYLRRLRRLGHLPLETNLLLTTNGVLVDEQVVQLCSENGVVVVVGLDGPREANNLGR
ncbi:MAG: radical SAM protein, partial [Patescibacteria group bacterium]